MMPVIFYGSQAIVAIITVMWFALNIVKIVGEFQYKIAHVPKARKQAIQMRMADPKIEPNSAEYKEYEKQLVEITKQNCVYGVTVFGSVALCFVIAFAIPELFWLSGLLIITGLCVITLFLLLDPKRPVGTKKIRVLERIALAILVPMSISIGLRLVSSIVDGALNLRPAILLLLPPLALYLMPRKLARLTVGMKNIFRRRG